MTKFLKKGIKSNGKYYPVSYNVGKLINGITYVTIYAKSLLKGLPQELNPQNNSDMMTDYFEKDVVKFQKGSTMYNELLKFCV